LSLRGEAEAISAEVAASRTPRNEKGDTPLLGMITLEALGYILDPLRCELRPLPMVLG
jgi:hypothetical protein